MVSTLIAVENCQIGFWNSPNKCSDFLNLGRRGGVCEGPKKCDTVFKQPLSVYAQIVSNMPIISLEGFNIKNR